MPRLGAIFAGRNAGYCAHSFNQRQKAIGIIALVGNDILSAMTLEQPTKRPLLGCYVT